MRTTMTLRIDEATMERLEAVASAMSRSKTWVLGQALAEYLDNQAWQVAEIQAGLREADAGDVVPHENVRGDWERRLADRLDVASSA